MTICFECATDTLQHIGLPRVDFKVSETTDTEIINNIDSISNDQNYERKIMKYEKKQQHIFRPINKYC